MAISISLEKMENRWIAFVTSLPGCYSSHEQQQPAIEAVPRAVREYLDWCRWNGVAVAGVNPDENVAIDEIVLEWFDAGGNPVNAFFAADVPPLSPADRVMAAALFDWTRADLLKAVDGLTVEMLERPVEDGWNINRILRHTLRSDWWYIHRLGFAPDWEEAPEPSGFMAVLEWTQSLYLAALPKMTGLDGIRYIEGEIWSPRKTIRRALWHRRDHTAHIYQFREKLQTAG